MLMMHIRQRWRDLTNVSQQISLLTSAIRRIVHAPRFQKEMVPRPEGRLLLVDVSTIVRQDVRTGIQRVVRALLGRLVNAKIAGVTVQPVFASRSHGYCRAVLFPDGRLVNASGHPNGLQPIEAKEGDLFLGLDLAAQVLPATESQLAAWRRLGVTVNIVVYDLLPIVQPDWFSPRLVRNFRKWLRVVSRQSDRCICISGAVAAELTKQLSIRAKGPHPEIVTIPLGSDLAASYPSLGLPENAAGLLGWMEERRTLLAVGTVEPRKGYDKLLAAVENIWRTDPSTDIALMIVGRAGWRSEQLHQRIREHPEYGVRLLWLDRASDELLENLYQNSAGLIAASHQEGFGLPLIEAMAYGAPILARDLPVFREIGGSLFDYFDRDEPDQFAGRIEEWLGAARRPNPSEVEALPRWSDSALALIDHLGLLQSPQEDLS